MTPGGPSYLVRSRCFPSSAQSLGLVQTGIIGNTPERLYRMVTTDLCALGEEFGKWLDKVRKKVLIPQRRNSRAE